MTSYARWVMTLCITLSGSTAFPMGGMGEDLAKAPPSFTAQGKTVIPVDFQYVDLTYDFDVTAKTAKAKSRIEFYSKDEGYPMIDLVPSTATSVKLNGTELGAGGLVLVSTPGSATQVRMVNGMVKPLAHNYLEIEYTIPSDVAAFASGGVRIVWSMGDVGQDREFLEQYAPSNLEFDQFTMDLSVTLTGATTKHRIFTNGDLREMASDRWSIAFPSYFTTSSFYFHLTDKQVAAEDFVYQGTTASIPVTVYSDSASTTSSGVSRTKSILAELESTYGPFAHKRVVVYLTSGGGGMEHCGATITSLSALGHELTHSWFARGVMPANGNAGWIDEATASWRDNGYPSSAMSLTGSPVNLAKFNTYERTTPMAAYSSGARLLSGFDAMFPNGLKGVLKEVFHRKQRETITTDMFQTLLEELSGKDLDTYFKRYVYNDSRVVAVRGPIDFMPRIPEPVFISLHPARLTKEEVAKIR